MVESIDTSRVHGNSRAKRGKYPFEWHPGICSSCGSAISSAPFEYEAPISRLRRNGSGLNARHGRGKIDAAAKLNPRRSKVIISAASKSMTQTELEDILDDGMAYTKNQIAELGFQRFGISRSKLMRLRKDDALESVRSALRNERILDMIAQEARIAGRARRA